MVWQVSTVMPCARCAVEFDVVADVPGGQGDRGRAGATVRTSESDGQRSVGPGVLDDPLLAQLIRETLDELKARTAGNDDRAKVEREVMPATGSVSVTGLSSQRGEDTRSWPPQQGCA